MTIGEKVYLWELDSVRNSDSECEIAREKFREELLVKGHVVVMTFNQLADARWMIRILENEENFAYLMQLFEMGAIKISHYRDIRTVSQYAQNSLKKALDKEDDFIFSGMPIKKEERYLLQEVLDAIRYCDPERLRVDTERIESLCNSSLDLSKGSELLKKIKKEKARLKKERNGSEKNKESERPTPFCIQACTYYYMLGIGNDSALLKVCLEYEIKRLKLIYQYVKLIIFVSREKATSNDAVEKSASFMDIMCAISRIEEKTLKKRNVAWAALFVKAIKDMRRMKAEKKNINKRSYWHDLIDEKRKMDRTSNEDLRDFQKLLADVCYNFTLESSIEGVYCAYDDSKDVFENTFIDRMDDYYKLYKEKVHSVYQLKNVEADGKNDLNWKQLAEIRKDIVKFEEQEKSSSNLEQMKWHMKVRVTQAVRPRRSLYLYILLFLVINLLLEKLQGGISTWSENKGWLQIIEWWQNGGTVEIVSYLRSVWRWQNVGIWQIAAWLLHGGALHICEWLLTNRITIMISIVEVIAFGMMASWVEKILKIPDILDVMRIFGHKIGNWRGYKKIKKRVELCNTNNHKNGKNTVR